MGIDDVIISEMYPHTDEEGTEWIVLKGESFTQWSRVYVNGTKISTTYVSGNELWVKASKVNDGDKIIVNQNGSKSTIFRSSNEFIYVAPPVDDATDTRTNEGGETSENVEGAEDGGTND